MQLHPKICVDIVIEKLLKFNVLFVFRGRDAPNVSPWE